MKRTSITYQRVLSRSIEGSIKFLTENLESTPEEITNWLKRNVPTSTTSPEHLIRMEAMGTAEAIVLESLIKEGRTDQATALLTLFNGFPPLVEKELKLFTLVLKRIKPDLSEYNQTHPDDTKYKTFLKSTLAQFKTLLNITSTEMKSNDDNTAEEQFNEASTLIVQVCGDSSDYGE